MRKFIGAGRDRHFLSRPSRFPGRFPFRVYVNILALDGTLYYRYSGRPSLSFQRTLRKKLRKFRGPLLEFTYQEYVPTGLISLGTWEEGMDVLTLTVVPTYNQFRFYPGTTNTRIHLSLVDLYVPQGRLGQTVMVETGLLSRRNDTPTHIRAFNRRLTWNKKQTRRN